VWLVFRVVGIWLNLFLFWVGMVVLSSIFYIGLNKMSSDNGVKSIIDTLSKMVVQNGRIQTSENGFATKFYFILAQEVCLRQQGLIPTCPDHRPAPCKNGQCFSMIAGLLINQCGPEEYVMEELPEGVCGCPFFHEQEEIDSVDETIKSILKKKGGEVIKKAIEKLFSLKYDTRDSSMRATMFDVEAGKKQEDQIILPWPIIGEERQARPQRTHSPAEVRHTAKAASRPVARPWREVVGLNDEDTTPVKVAAEESKRHVDHLKKMLETEKLRLELLREKEASDRQAREMERELASVRKELLSLRRDVGTHVKQQAPPKIVHLKPKPKQPAAPAETGKEEKEKNDGPDAPANTDDDQ